MTIPDSRTGQPDAPRDSAGSEQNFQHLKEEVTEAIAGARHQADEQFGQYRDTAADQIEALARGAQSAISEIKKNDTHRPDWPLASRRPRRAPPTIVATVPQCRGPAPSQENGDEQRRSRTATHATRPPSAAELS